jgi:hypothetical protein
MALSPSMSEGFFHLVPAIVANEKYFDVSRDEIERNLADENGRVEYETEHSIEDEFGKEIVVTLRLNINCQSPVAVGWTISLKLHGVRIDGIDWHAFYTDPGGNQQQGWHRHLYSSATKSADGQRLPVDGFHILKNRRDFLIRALSEMKLLLSGVDYGADELPFN